MNKDPHSHYGLSRNKRCACSQEHKSGALVLSVGVLLVLLLAAGSLGLCLYLRRRHANARVSYRQLPQTTVMTRQAKIALAHWFDRLSVYIANV